ncbi:putative succinyl-CoA:3-ketoacid coenzyme A transferase subunit A [Candidatus Entotheonellaceae bacterium PAL068K]
MDKVYQSSLDAVADIPDGASIMFGGFGRAGLPVSLIHALRQRGVKRLTAIVNSPGFDYEELFTNEQIVRLVSSFPVVPSSFVEEGQTLYSRALIEAGKVEVELVPQGTLVERIRAGGAGIPAFYTPTGVGTQVAADKEVREFNGQRCLMEQALRADYALIKAYQADRMGNLVYRLASRNFNPIMAMAATTTIAEAEDIVEVGDLDPDRVVTPSLFVQRVVQGEINAKWT